MWKYFFLKENTKIRWWFCVLCSIYVVLFTYILEPLKNEKYHYNYPDYYNYIAIIAFFAIISFFSIYLPHKYSNFFHSEEWSFGRFMLWFFLLFFTGILFSCIFDFYTYKFEYTVENIFSYFFNFQFAVDLFTVLPILLFFLSSFSSLNLQKTDEKPAVLTLENEIPSNYSIISKSESVKPENDSILLSFTDKNGKNELQINLHQLFYITSASNYVDIFYKNEDGQINSSTLRNTLKTIEEQYINQRGFFRCHKAFIVNCEKVKAIKGSAKGYFLVLEEIKEKIPVSRNKNEDLQNLFPNLF